MTRSDASSMRRAWPRFCSYEGGRMDLGSKEPRSVLYYGGAAIRYSRRMPLFRASAARTRALLAVLAVVSLVALFTTRVSRKMPDFQVYWTAGARAMHAEPLYRADDGHYQFKYLPAFAIFAAPAAMMPLPAAKGVWFAASAVLMMALLLLSVRALPQVHRPPALLLVLTFLAMAKFYAHELVLGQVNLLFGAIAVLAMVWLRQGRDAAAGLLFALAVVVKPYGVIF